VFIDFTEAECFFHDLLHIVDVADTQDDRSKSGDGVLKRNWPILPWNARCDARIPFIRYELIQLAIKISERKDFAVELLPDAVMFHFQAVKSLHPVVQCRIIRDTE